MSAYDDYAQNILGNEYTRQYKKIHAATGIPEDKHTLKLLWNLGELGEKEKFKRQTRIEIQQEGSLMMDQIPIFFTTLKDFKKQVGIVLFWITNGKFDFRVMDFIKFLGGGNKLIMNDKQLQENSSTSDKTGRVSSTIKLVTSYFDDNFDAKAQKIKNDMAVVSIFSLDDRGNRVIVNLYLKSPKNPFNFKEKDGDRTTDFTKRFQDEIKKFLNGIDPELKTRLKISVPTEYTLESLAQFLDEIGKRISFVMDEIEKAKSKALIGAPVSKPVDDQTGDRKARRPTQEEYKKMEQKLNSMQNELDQLKMSLKDFTSKLKDAESVRDKYLDYLKAIANLLGVNENVSDIKSEIGRLKMQLTQRTPLVSTAKSEQTTSLKENSNNLDALAKLLGCKSDISAIEKKLNEVLASYNQQQELLEYINKTVKGTKVYTDPKDFVMRAANSYGKEKELLKRLTDYAINLRGKVVERNIRKGENVAQYLTNLMEIDMSDNIRSQLNNVIQNSTFPEAITEYSQNLKNATGSVTNKTVIPGTKNITFDSLIQEIVKNEKRLFKERIENSKIPTEGMNVILGEIFDPHNGEYLKELATDLSDQAMDLDNDTRGKRSEFVGEEESKCKKISKQKHNLVKYKENVESDEEKLLLSRVQFAMNH